MDAARRWVRRSDGGLWTGVICSVPIGGVQVYLFAGIQIHIQGFSAFHTFPYALCAG